MTMMTSPVPLSRSLRSAFTVLELLISIAIVGILAVLLAFSGRAISASSMSVRCVSNLRQTGAAMLHYIQDRNQTLQSFHGGASVDENWVRKLFMGGYLNPDNSGANENAILLKQIDSVGEVVRCPAGPIDETFKTTNQLARDNPRRWIWQAYGMGMYRNDIPLKSEVVGGKTTVLFSVKTTAISDPGRYILLADSCGNGPGYFQSFRISRNAGEGGLALRHRGLANAFFLDGRVDQLNRERAQELGVPNHSIHEPELP